MTRQTFTYIFLLALTFSSVSCKSISLGHAKKSLQGTWKVTYIYSEEKDSSGYRKTGQHKESGDLGFFKFSEKEVSYNYNRINKNYSNTCPWTLSAKYVPHSFIWGICFTLTFNDQAYRVRFGNGTANSEKNARKIEFHPAWGHNYTKPYHTITLIKE